MIDLMEIPGKISQLLTEHGETLTTHSTCISDRGSRATNDDRCFTNDAQGIYLLVDGIGGHEGGRFASQIAAATISKSLESEEGTKACDCEGLEHCLENAVNKTCRSMARLARMNAKYEHMGCTLALAVKRGKSLHFTSAGCVRIYLFRRGKLRQLNEDDSLVQGLVDAHAVSVENAKHHQWRNIITNSLTANGFGHAPKWHSIELHRDDQVLIATNGIYNSLTDRQMTHVLHSPIPLEAKVEQLVRTARQAENTHNASCILFATEPEA